MIAFTGYCNAASPLFLPSEEHVTRTGQRRRRESITSTTQQALLKVGCHRYQGQDRNMRLPRALGRKYQVTRLGTWGAHGYFSLFPFRVRSEGRQTFLDRSTARMLFVAAVLRSNFFSFLLIRFYVFFHIFSPLAYRQSAFGK